jgi:hypothetical protein
MIVELDVQMHSPPNSPTHDLRGASRITGGFARGHALGNVYNFADDPDIFFDQHIKSKTGKVLVYTTMGNPDDIKPIMSLKHEVSATIGPVLAKLAHRYTQIDSMFYLFIQFKMIVNYHIRVQLLCLGV